MPIQTLSILERKACQGDTDAMLRLARNYHAAGDYESAYTWHYYAGKGGDPNGYYEAARLVESGKAENGDLLLAKELFTDAYASMGTEIAVAKNSFELDDRHSNYAFLMSKLVFDGKVDSRIIDGDPQKVGIEWLEKAFQMDHPHAAYELGSIYNSFNREKALEYFMMAAYQDPSQPNTQAMYEAGKIFEAKGKPQMASKFFISASDYLINECHIAPEIFRRILGTGKDTDGFSFEGISDRLYVFGNSVDMMSFLTLHERDVWQRHSYVSLGDGSVTACDSLLAANPNITTVVLCLGKDDAGRNTTSRIAESLRIRGHSVYNLVPENGTDWNDHLLNQKSIQNPAGELFHSAGRK